MIPFVLLLLTAVLTGWQLFYRIMLGIWGVPNHWFHGVSFACCIVLAVAAYVTLWSRRAGLRISALALLGIGFSFVPSLPSLIWPPPDRVLRWYIYIPSILFYITAAYVVIGLVRSHGAATVLYPASSSGAFKIAVAILTVGVAAACVWYVSGLGRRQVSTQQMTWDVMQRNGNTGSEPLIKLTSVKRSRHTITVASLELRSRLQQTKPAQVSVVVEKIYDHNKYKGWSLKTVGGVSGAGLEWLGSTDEPD